MYLGIDIGGSHIGIGLVDKDYKILCKEEIDIDSSYTKERIIKTCTEEIDNMLDENKLSLFQLEYIGLGIPGCLSEEKVIAAENLGIYDFNIVEEFRKYDNYKSIPIFIENDGNCAAIAEYRCGVLADTTNSALIVVGTGVGSGIIINRKLYKGSNNLAGEIGHMCMEEDGELCNCGHKGCFERYSSMKLLKTKVSKALGLDKVMHGKELVRLLKEGNEIAQNELKLYIEYLSTGIANYLNILDLEKIALGGSIVHFKEFLLDDLSRKINEKTYNRISTCKIEMASVGNDAGILGAALQQTLKIL